MLKFHQSTQNRKLHRFCFSEIQNSPAAGLAGQAATSPAYSPRSGNSGWWPIRQGNTRRGHKARQTHGTTNAQEGKSLDRPARKSHKRGKPAKKHVNEIPLPWHRPCPPTKLLSQRTRGRPPWGRSAGEPSPAPILAFSEILRKTSISNRAKIRGKLHNGPQCL